MRNAGFSLIELVVALLIFATVALGLAQTLVAAQRARWTSECWMRATQLAEERLERIRAGDTGDPTAVVDGFNVSSQRQVAPGYTGLHVVMVKVAWTDRVERAFVLQSLVRPRP